MAGLLAVEDPAIIFPEEVGRSVSKKGYKFEKIL